MAAASVRGPLRGESCLNSKTMEGDQAGRRRVFVQTESGCVMGIELDGCENARTVKKKLQLSLNVPTEETSLTCGDTVLKNDLSTVRNHSPLLLTRNCLHRSSSTPCLSPSVKDLFQRDQSSPIEVIGCSSNFFGIKQLVSDIVEALKNGIDPMPVRSGLGGAYFFRDSNGENAAIIKPTDEEPFAPNNPKGFIGKALGQPGLKCSVRVGETGFREVAAYLLDYDGFANVPLTALVKVTHPIFNVNNDGVNGNGHQQRGHTTKIASFQQYIHHDCDASDYGTSSFPVSVVHRIGILDIRMLNTDRHAGNLLVRKLDDGDGRFNQVDLVPIDHGLSLPESLEDPYFEWIHWPQASIPFSEDELQYIENLDPFYDSELLRVELPMIHEACLRVLILCTIFLKEAASFGLCLAEVGEMMSREFKGHAEEPSKLELLCIDARSLLQRSEMGINTSPKDEDGFLFDLECEFFNGNLSRTLEDKLSFQKTSGKNGMDFLFEVEEGSEEGKRIDTATGTKNKEGRIGDVGDNTWIQQQAIQQERCFNGTPMNKSANELFSSSSSFVNLVDMNEDEWLAFLDNFQKFLRPTFVNHKAGRAGQRLMPRFGTSCKF
ncbi:phosphatidylinositol 4-kinase gamma 6-like [Chenopodium quinoa]|uniref:1-phosphatidylinositol 4-kinase n=1 Tax=Chenopodium quinoa TaxID=63459 RepID=A0A803LC81_CHEQI|nr:phosphatidylinositol 4-kinase gamma 6-like [Chenopodium quinoa]XP_021739370.1 phosphatidylinositol 4-kinase gamma 6-like [Chenopodium quinoa]